MLRKRRLLMLPGPNETYPEILESLREMVLPHYGPEWEEIYLKTCDEMKRIFLTENDVIIYPGSGATTIEMAVANIVEKGDKAIVINNGFFGKFLEDSVRSHGAEVVSLRPGIGKGIEPESVREAVKKNKDAKAIFVVQNETSTGVLNPVKEIGEIAGENDKLLFVDSISALGGIEMRVDKWNVDLCVGYASKALGSIPVLAPISISEDVWSLIEKRKEPVKPYFLDLSKWKSMRWGGPHPVTMPTTSVLALRKAISIALREGLENRFKRHRIAGKAAREGIRAMGLKVLPEERYASDTTTAVLTPDGMESRILSLLAERFNIMIGGSLGDYLKGRLLRIGHMGLTASPEYVIPTIYALEQVLMEIGVKVEEGAGVSAALKVFNENSTEWIKGLLTRFQYRFLPAN